MSSSRTMPSTLSSHRPLFSEILPSSTLIGDDQDLQYHNRNHLPAMLDNMNLDQMIILRSLLSWIYARYFHMYEQEWEAMYGDSTKNVKPGKEISEDLQELVGIMGCSMDEVVMVIDQIERDIFHWGSLTESIVKYDAQNPYRYKRMNVQGLPYLLRVEQSAQTEKLRALHGRIEHIRFTHYQLEKVINYQSLMDEALPISHAMERQGIHPLQHV